MHTVKTVVVNHRLTLRCAIAEPYNAIITIQPDAIAQSPILCRALARSFCRSDSALSAGISLARYNSRSLNDVNFRHSTTEQLFAEGSSPVLLLLVN